MIAKYVISPNKKLPLEVAKWTGAPALQGQAENWAGQAGEEVAVSLCGDLIASALYLEGACREAGEGFSIWNCSDRTRSNGFKFKERNFRL